mgnify:CR=1 FL=1
MLPRSIVPACGGDGTGLADRFVMLMLERELARVAQHQHEAGGLVEARSRGLELASRIDASSTFGLSKNRYAALGAAPS